jgi:signal transduction histidine kinase
MTRAEAPLIVAYTAALQDYIDGRGEPALHRANELGRIALERGLGILEITGIHQLASDRVVARVAGDAAGELSRARADVFLLETLSPFEMTHRGFQDALAMLRRVNEAMESESRRIAHALHDETNQTLAAACISLEDLDRGLPEAAHGRLVRIGAALREAAERLRRISHELRPTVLDDLGLVPALEFLAEGYAERTGRVVAVYGTATGRLPTAMETALYRVAQEAIANAIRHGNARRIEIRIKRVKSSIVCSIRDNGVGFDPVRAKGSVGAGGLGLLGIRERIHALGGTVWIESAHGQGAVLRIDLPMEARNAVADPAR